MNKYGAMAKKHWASVDPERYAQIEDPEAFFGDLGEQAMSQILDLQTQLAGPDSVGETYLEKVGRLNMARLQAEEVVLSDLVWISGPQSEQEQEGEAPDPFWVAYRQADRELDEQIQLKEERERERQRQAWLKGNAKPQG